MKKSVEAQLYDFFRSNPNDIFASGDLQRREWKNGNGSLATPRSIVRRLQELAEEGKIHQVGDMKHAKYSLNKEKAPPRFRIEYDPIKGVAIQVPCN